MTQPAERVEPPSVGRDFTPEEFRAVMGRFITGVTVVTLQAPDGPHGTTVNSFSSVSLDPPMVLICLRRGARTAHALEYSGHFAVNILAQHQQSLGRLFATRSRPSGSAAFAHIAHRTGVTGVPLLDGSVAHIECVSAGRLRAGDHIIFMGEVVAVAAHEDIGPLAFHRGKFLAVS